MSKKFLFTLLSVSVLFVHLSGAAMAQAEKLKFEPSRPLIILDVRCTFEAAFGSDLRFCTEFGGVIKDWPVVADNTKNRLVVSLYDPDMKLLVEGQSQWEAKGENSRCRFSDIVFEDFYSRTNEIGFFSVIVEGVNENLATAERQIGIDVVKALKSGSNDFIKLFANLSTNGVINSKGKTVVNQLMRTIQMTGWTDVELLSVLPVDPADLKKFSNPAREMFEITFGPPAKVDKDGLSSSEALSIIVGRTARGWELFESEKH